MHKLFVVVAGLAVLGAVGCGVGTTESSGNTAGTGGTAGSGGDAGSSGTGGSGASMSGCPDLPWQGSVAEECGIWASLSLGDDANPGTQAAPVKSLVRAVELAAEGPGRVYACAEKWNDPLVVPGHVSLHGGFECAGGWAYVAEDKVGGDKRAMLLTGPDQISIKYVDAGKGGEAFLTNFFVRAANAATPSGSSLALLVRDEVTLTIDHCELIAGSGADGLDGTPADPMEAMSGSWGKAGAKACFSGDVGEGGAPTETMCPDGISRGGAGGDSSGMIAADGAAGEPAGALPGGAAGLGEQSAPACTHGQDGAKGADGAHGHGGAARGHLTEDGYFGNPGQDGKPGALGQGGGGGGATFGGPAGCGGMTPAAGAAGGSGGAGGCGGKGGGGGQPGGSSIAVAMRGQKARAQYRNTYLYGWTAAHGGDGGSPQPGGYGGAWSPGGNGGPAINQACNGGLGGRGGSGGWGGGGSGGNAACSVSVGDNGWVRDEASQCQAAGRGIGGTGAPMNPESEGEWGVFDGMHDNVELKADF